MFVPDYVITLLGFAIILFVAGFVALGLHLANRFSRNLRLKAIKRQYMVLSNPKDHFEHPRPL